MVPSTLGAGDAVGRDLTVQESLLVLHSAHLQHHNIKVEVANYTIIGYIGGSLHADYYFFQPFVLLHSCLPFFEPSPILFGLAMAAIQLSNIMPSQTPPEPDQVAVTEPRILYIFFYTRATRSRPLLSLDWNQIEYRNPRR
jgi:hypothetical protein